MDDKSSYRSIFKAISVFGGVQAITILVNIIRSKIIAIFLGPFGIGISSLLNNALGIINSLTGFGIGASAVKNVSESYNFENKSEFNKTLFILKSVVWKTSIFGAIVTLLLCFPLSKITFGNYSYTFTFVLLSIAVFFTQITNYPSVVLRSIRNIKLFAKSNLYSAIIGLIITFPIYYFLKNQGIIISIVLISIVNYLVSLFFFNQKKFLVEKVAKHELNSKSKELIKVGFFISLSGLVAVLSSYIVRIFLNDMGGMVVVGLYSAGFSIIGNYVNMIFSAMGIDYYPRLSMISNNNELMSKEVNKQILVGVLILAPILCFFLIFCKWAVILLYSKQFLPIISMLQWATIGMLFKVVSWSIAFIFLAKSDSKIYLLNEIIASIYTIAFNIIGYYFLGLTGLGISFLISYILYLIQNYLICYKRFNFIIEKKILIVFVIQCISVLLILLVSTFIHGFQKDLINFLLLLFSILYSFFNLKNILGIKFS